ncbi:hypothetical protein CAEBREN_04590 [Caenorhabditis brenneri]|uniref:Uncharacterized protein n=1 Tax=Caenorhabditis brenneri TaxID=135651 RepID=G0NSY4_CAEBE|nr:hypothetical protein CAEBREN_04590 [Caenorhabditis brenneri]
MSPCTGMLIFTLTHRLTNHIEMSRHALNKNNMNKLWSQQTKEQKDKRTRKMQRF